ncbi:MAG TPA: nuclear transport factor 2 family protein [Gaiellales bacterium]|nr:nuclear transport factor 2 family protein [Gaiellales bacterium]
MPADVVEALLRDTERRRLRSLVDRDLALAGRLHADDYELIPPGGDMLTKAAYLAGIETGALVYEVFEPASDVAVRLYADAAVLRYRARIEIHGEGWRDSGLFWHTDIYERRERQWVAVWSQATRIPEPT